VRDDQFRRLIWCLGILSGGTYLGAYVAQSLGGVPGLIVILIGAGFTTIAFAGGLRVPDLRAGGVIPPSADAHRRAFATVASTIEPRQQPSRPHQTIESRHTPVTYVDPETAARLSLIDVREEYARALWDAIPRNARSNNLKRIRQMLELASAQVKQLEQAHSIARNAPDDWHARASECGLDMPQWILSDFEITAKTARDQLEQLVLRYLDRLRKVLPVAEFSGVERQFSDKIGAATELVAKRSSEREIAVWDYLHDPDCPIAE
jgi:hypothetical protein